MLRETASNPTNRINTIIFIVVMIGILIGIRLFFLQAVNYGYYEARAEDQQSFSKILEAKRGNILAHSKTGEEIFLAATQNGFILFLNNKLLQEKGVLYEKLNGITPIDETLFAKTILKENDPYEILKKRITQNEADAIAILKLKGVGLEPESWRYYPGGALASHLLGFVAESADGEPEGKYGAEKYYNSDLNGEEGTLVADKDAKGLLIALGSQFVTDAKEGENITLTIDPDLQRFTEAEITKVMEKWSAESAGVIIIEPKTGRIKTMAASPSFDPNEYQKEKNLGVFLNPFTEKIFEMGSVFKPLTMTAALDQGVLTPDTTYVDKGEVKIGSATIHNYDYKARGTVNMTHVLEESLNTGAVFAMQKIGGEKLREYFHNYGLGEKLGIDLPGELRGDLSNLDSGREVEFATAAFGQGVAVTPLELAMALATLGNGGKLMRPYINDANSPKMIRQVIKPETSTAISKMLVDVVDLALAGGNAKIDGYSIAAKTGTAQIPKKDGKGYSDQYLHTFFGYFPAYDPQYLILMFLEKPRGVQYASHSLTDTFSELVEFMISYYTIPPDR
ncbi:MAG: Peptidoglycan glycosyltransferase [Candidatus Giovannonibacteria bacterium GW2011_GWA2_44_13b]|uniref:Peptidoglycan glycosyltransferase n=2 Tax=Candidatus Giovannoniibacteriota TaxID=1752738 RepID=A0A0G1H4M2_9BACT|nr:MAG: Peptidoglycan glycosyltransferase [Candidatus Giovannonibacteria bacterium GW2011_GWA2_44_13b]OGF83248.1 MAG: hypothetical protein A2924_02945 [Candidatus Giovannonibacteria bacterium RIFCSPLOWO2_01_FULL_44_16]